VSEAPDAIGRYKIVHRIGQGGMGVLFLAFDPMLERQVAIKLLRDDNEELRERFAREARSVARLRHPHIVTIFDVGEQDGHPFIAMEYLQGQTLADIIRAALPIDVPRKLQVIDELCDGLSFAHKVGIVHRDVKPANVMVEHDGAVKILDFGIARIAESGMTQAGMLIGTLNYMSPEQVAGQIVDGRSDIFAVGAVLYELLAYRQAFPGGLQNGILHRIMHGDPASLETACPGLDVEVIRIVDRALQKDPDTRYQDLQTMRKDLQRAKQRLEQNLPETVAVRPQEAPDTIGLEAPTTPARRPSQTPRWGTDRDGLAKRRAAQVAAHVSDARRAMDTGAFDEAVVAAEQALLLHAEEPEALRILERARLALDDRQLKEWLARGADLLQEGQHTEALALAEHALTLAPGSPAALELRRAIDQSRAAQEQERQRKEATQAAMARARESFDRQAYEEALQAADEAVSQSPELPEVNAFRARVQEAIVRQRQAALERRVTSTLAQAERLFAEGQHDEAIAILASADRDDPRIASALHALRAQAARMAREREQARQRDEAIAAAVARAKAATSHEDAIAILNDAQALDPARTDVRSLLERRRAALEIEQETARRTRERDEQIGAMVARAARTGSHDAALGILKEAQALDPTRADVRGLIDSRQAALDAEREEARRAAERQQKLSAAIAKASRTKSHEAAIAILEEAVALDPGDAGTRALLDERRAALARDREEASRVKERQETIAAAVARAAATPSHEAAVAILNEALALDAQHAGAREAFDKRTKALEREREEARKLRERHEFTAAAIARAGSTTEHEAAIAILTEALTRDQGHVEITRALEARRQALEGDARRARERREQVAAALVKATATTAHDAAISILEAATALDPGNADVQEALAARRVWLEREQHEARHAREREERIAAAIASAKKTAAHEEAIAILNEALALDPTNTTIPTVLTTRQTALEREREQARLEAERQAKIASAIKQARSATSHEAAITLLKQAVAFDASNTEARGLLETREAALDAERAEARRVQELEAARLSIVALIERQNFDAAEAALQKAAGLQPKKTVKDLRRQLRDGQRAKTAAAAGPGQVEARAASLRPATLGIAAAIVGVIAVGGYFLMNNLTPSTSPANQPPVSANAPAAGNTAPPGSSPSPAPVATPSPSVTPSSEPAAAPPSVPAADPAAALAAKSTAAIQIGRQRLAQRDLRQAWETAAAGLKADPSNVELRRLESDIVASARQQAAAAHASAAGRGEFATGSGLFKNAQTKETEGVRLQRARRSDQAIRAFAEAVDLFARADREAQQRAAAPPSAEPSARPPQPDPTPPTGARSNPPAEPVSPPVTAPALPAATPTNPPVTVSPAPKPAPPPAAPAVNDEELIRAVLRSYAAAYASLDVAAVQRVYPSVNAASLRRSFAEYRSFEVQISQEQISVNGSEATVTCRVRQSFVPKVGSGRSDTLTATFELRKVGTQWVIASRR
jgi:hypothetical protein